MNKDKKQEIINELRDKGLSVVLNASDKATVSHAIDKAHEAGRKAERERVLEMIEKIESDVTNRRIVHLYDYTQALKRMKEKLSANN